MVSPHHQWSLPLIREEGDGGMAEELLVPLSGLPCSQCRAKVNGMESGSDPPLGPILSLL
jgi:hypothetical protein